jgi:phage-related protein
MANSTMPLTTKISQASQMKRAPKMLVSSFGDGYEQIAPDGINNVRQQWTIVWENLNSTDCATLENTWATTRYGADYVTWTPPLPSPLNVQKKYRINSMEMVAASGNIYTYNAQITQVFDI